MSEQPKSAVNAATGASAPNPLPKREVVGPRNIPAGDISKPLTQEAVNELYTQLYKEISEAQAAAHKQGKPLKIVLGEHHDDGHSYMRKLMITDIGARLGIRDGFIEQSGNGFDKMSESMQFISKDYVDSATMVTMTHPELKHLSDNYTRLRAVEGSNTARLIDNISGGIQLAVYSDIEKAKDKDTQPLSIFFTNAGYTIHPGDPERDNAKTGKARALFSPIRECAMVEGCGAHKGDSVNVVGSLHIPFYVAEWDPKKNGVLLAYDISNVKLTGQTDYKPLANRMETYNNMLVIGQIRKPISDGVAPSYTDGTQMAYEAAIAHRSRTLDGKGKPELSTQDAAQIRDYLHTFRKVEEKRAEKRAVSKGPAQTSWQEISPAFLLQPPMLPTLPQTSLAAAQSQGVQGKRS